MKRGTIVAIIVLILIALAATLYFYYTPKETEEPQLSPTQTVTRTINQIAGSSLYYIDEEISIDITVDLDEASDSAYTIIENFLPEATLIDGGLGDLNAIDNELVWIDLLTNPAGSLQDATYNYKISFSSPGSYALSGTYVFNEDTTINTITGDTQITVQGCTPDAGGEVCDSQDNNCDRVVDENPEDLCTYDPANPDDAYTCTVGSCTCESTHDIDKPTGTPVPGNCNGCVDAGEITTYINAWKAGGSDIGQVEITTAASRWATGASAC